MLAPPEVAQTHAPAPAPLAQALAAKLEDITARAHAADLAFHAAQAPARRQCAAALGAAPGSVEWGAANDAIAVLDGQRAATAFALADIEQIYTDDRIAHALEDGASGEPGARPTAAAIAQTRAAIIAIIAREDGVMRELSAQLKG